MKCIVSYTMTTFAHLKACRNKYMNTQILDSYKIYLQRVQLLSINISVHNTCRSTGTSHNSRKIVRTASM